MSQRPSALLPIIVFSQFAGTSLWFAGNAIMADIHPNGAGLANITSIVQFGFIAGTLIFSLLVIADRFSASVVFFFSSCIAALANFLLIWLAKDVSWLFALRFITGFFLAGIYPVGMKIAADCFPGRLGNALGFLVGALVLGTAFPHILRSQLQQFNWKDVIVFTSLLALCGGLLILLFVPKFKSNSGSLHISAAWKVFRSGQFRAAAFGYFGHMWELYAFWAFVPVIINRFNEMNHAHLNIPLWSFVTIAAGSLGCVVGGVLSQKSGSKKVAFSALLISGFCCLLSPLLFGFSEPAFLFFLQIWGLTVVADSPQFSTLVARLAPAENKGTALTIVTSVGFAITIISIQLLKPALGNWKEYGLLILLPGPLFGLLSLVKLKVDRGR